MLVGVVKNMHPILYMAASWQIWYFQFYMATWQIHCIFNWSLINVLATMLGGCEMVPHCCMWWLLLGFPLLLIMQATKAGMVHGL